VVISLSVSIEASHTSGAAREPMPGDVGTVVCTEIAVVSLTLRTRWMSPGGLNALTSPT
jgi:hypothetical protein